MKVLWITNILFPEARQSLTGRGDLKASGGWMLGAANALLEKKDCRLFVATVSNIVTSLTKIQGERITYYVLPLGKGNTRPNPEYIPYWKRIEEEIHPDIVHIHGTEFTQGLAYVNACGNKNVVVSIQGMKSVIAQYYTAGITLGDRLRNITFRDILKGGIGHEAKEYAKQGKNEIELLRKVNHVIGRTVWDKAHTWACNHDIIYHHCNETLRPEFYLSPKWNYDNCQKHSIFLSQAWYPLKGAHVVLKVAAKLVRKYPDLQIRIAGDDMMQYANLRGMVHYTTYAKYLTSLVRKNNLQNRIMFLGPLSTQEMINEYLNCNVFICPSSIENSPNSLGEAQILGTPVIASYAGGIPSMMKGLEEYIFRFEDLDVLEYLIDTVFYQGSNYNGIISEASQRHDATLNNQELLKIYQIILEECTL